MANVAQITPEIITWAREEQKLTQLELADKISVHENQIAKWEDGKTKPTFRQAQNLADTLRIPFGYLFLSTPPRLEDPLPDLRTRRDRPIKRMSTSLREVVYGVLDIQDWYREYRVEYEAEKLDFVGSFNTKSNITTLAESIRSRLSLTPEQRETVNTPSKYLSLLVSKAEACGVLVMQSGVVGNDNNRPLSVSEFQGFVAVDDLAPIVFINARDFVNARIFTLIHELVHIWIGKSGVLNPDEALLEPSSSVETFCNAVAAETLVPKDEFLRVYDVFSGSVDRLVRHFRVSRIVILRKAFELNKVTANEFYSTVRLYRTTLQETKKSGGGVEYPELVSGRHSPTVMDSIIKDVRAGGTMIRDGARLLHMKAPTFTKIAQTGEY